MDAAEEFAFKIVSFIEQLASESERAAVVLGTARLDVALEKVLCSLMQPIPDGQDNLFASDRPLGTFSAKIALAYRLGLIDNDFEHALQMIRKIRNDFAHSVEAESLSSQTHKSRITEATRVASRSSRWKMYEGGFKHFSGGQELKQFSILLVLLISNLETLVEVQPRFSPVTVLRLHTNVCNTG